MINEYLVKLMDGSEISGFSAKSWDVIKNNEIEILAFYDDNDEHFLFIPYYNIMWFRLLPDKNL